MAVYERNIKEVILFREAVRKNLHTANIFETLPLTQRLRSNIKILRINEQVRLSESVKRVGGIRNLAINESLSFAEKTHPRVSVFNISESLQLREFTSNLTIGDKLVMVEIVTYQLVKTISEQLDIVETLTFKSNRNLLVAENLVISEGLTAAIYPTHGPVRTTEGPAVSGIAIQGAPVGTINGVNTVFTLSDASINNLNVYINGVVTTAYNLVGATITFNVAPPIGSNIYINYFK